MLEEVFWKGTDTAGNYHWHGTETGHHVIPKQPTEYIIPISCLHCANHPSNGGSGICHCTLGMQTVH